MVDKERKEQTQRKKRTQRKSSGSPGRSGSTQETPAASRPPVLKGRAKQTLDALFARPDRLNIQWNDFVAMMTAAGAVVTTSGGGSAHSFAIRGHVLVVHRPHPGNELYMQLVRRVRKFLARINIRP
jgi:hypothetical protein